MSEDGQQDGEVRALRELVEELRADAPPPVDWDRLEQRLMKQVDLELKARQRRPSHWGSLAAFAAAAAAVALLITGLGAPPTERASADGDSGNIVDLKQLPTERADNGIDGYRVASLPPRSLISSGDEPLRFTLAGVASWELAPHSRVVVASSSVPHVLTLQQGAVHAEVVPRHESDQLVETFAIEVGTTRVAVHGTAFTVERHDDHVSVTVSRGTVAVGPTGHRGITSRHLLTSPARARFSLNGGRLIDSLPHQDARLLARASTGLRDAANQPPPLRGEVVVTPSEPSAPRTTPPLAGRPDLAPVAAGEPNPGDGNAAPDSTPPPDAVVLDRATARSLVIACVQAASGGAGAPKTRVTISSHVTVTASDNGMVGAVRFVPPLRPDVQQSCASSLFGRKMAEGTNLSFSIDIAAR